MSRNPERGGLNQKWLLCQYLLDLINRIFNSGTFFYFHHNEGFAEYSSPEYVLPDISSPEDSSLEKKLPGGGSFFAGVFFARMLLRRIILR
jgi:hypothetical protein